MVSATPRRAAAHRLRRKSRARVPSTSRVKFSEVSITLAGVHRLSEDSKERLPKMPEDVDELSTTPRKTSTMV